MFVAIVKENTCTQITFNINNFIDHTVFTKDYRLQIITDKYLTDFNHKIIVGTFLNYCNCPVIYEQIKERGETLNSGLEGTIFYQKLYGRSGFRGTVHSSSDDGEFQKRPLSREERDEERNG